MIRPDSLGVPMPPAAARILLSKAPWEGATGVQALLTRACVPPATIAELRRTWEGLHTVVTLDAMYRAAPAVVDPDTVDPAHPDREPPMTAAEAAEVIGLGSRRVRELVTKGHLTEVPHAGRRVMLDAARVREYAAARAARSAA